MILIIPLLIIGCEAEEEPRAATLIDKDSNNINLNEINSYDIEVDLDNENKSYRGKQITTYINKTDTTLGELYFHLYPNAFKSYEDAPILFSKENYSASDYIGGHIDIDTISVNNIELNHSIKGEDDTILHIKLKEPLLKGQEIKVYMEYEVKLPTTKDRFGYGDRTMNLGNWYPIACVYDEDGWNLDPYYKIGDPFYSDIANYKVSISVPKNMIVASSGNIVSEEIKDKKKTYEIEGELIRDFAWVASEDFAMAQKEVDGTLVKLYYLDENPSMMKKSLEIGENSLKVFNKLFGQYPYGAYSIVMTEFPTGMEYPGIVFISEDYFREELSSRLEQVIVHETAHQWWYGLVGNDQIKEAWLDESLASYSESIYYKEIYGEEIGKQYFDQNIKIGYDISKSYLKGEGNIVNKPLDEFKDWNDYSILVYSKGAMFIDAIKEEFGEKVLYKILGEYFKEYKYYNANTEDFIEVCEDVTKKDFTDFVNEWLY